MTAITWDPVDDRTYETGVDHGVLYVYDPTTKAYGKGVAWNGLTGVTESPSGAEASAQYADNIKYLSLLSAEEFSGTIEAFTYPDAFAVCDGTAEPATGIYIGQQSRRTFALSYRTKKGNGSDDNYGYKLHIIYGALAAPSEKAYATVNDSPEPITFSWSVSTTPIAVTGYKPTATLTIDSTRVDPVKLKLVEDALYGGGSSEPKLMLPDEVVALVGLKAAGE